MIHYIYILFNEYNVTITEACVHSFAHIHTMNNRKRTHLHLFVSIGLGGVQGGIVGVQGSEPLLAHEPVRAHVPLERHHQVVVALETHAHVVSMLLKLKNYLFDSDCFLNTFNASSVLYHEKHQHEVHCKSCVLIQIQYQNNSTLIMNEIEGLFWVQMSLLMSSLVIQRLKQFRIKPTHVVVHEMFVITEVYCTFSAKFSRSLTMKPPSSLRMLAVVSLRWILHATTMDERMSIM